MLSSVLRQMPCLLLLLALLGWAVPAWATDLPVIKIYYYIRPPYYVEDGSGGVTGLVAEPVLRAVALAGWPMQWEVLPAGQQIERIQENAGPACALGWFRTPQREAFARFSEELYRDGPMVGVARRAVQGLTDGMTLQESLTRGPWTVLVKESFSYGATVDPLLQELGPRRIVTQGENTEMMHMIRQGQADLLLLAPEEVAHLFTLEAFTPADFQIIHFSDAPPGNRRYLMCTRKTPLIFLRRFNLGLQGLPHLP